MSQRAQFKERKAEYFEKYSDLLLDGLKDGARYLELLREDEFHIAVRPEVRRVGKVVFFAAKLRVGTNAYYENPSKFKPGTKEEEAILERLLSFTELPPLFWMSSDARRASTLFGIAFKASKRQKEEFIESNSTKDLAKALFEQLESATGKKLKNKMKVVNALTFYFDTYIQYCLFDESPEAEEPVEVTSYKSVVNIADVDAAKSEASEVEVEES
jgi:hypothetical protein